MADEEAGARRRRRRTRVEPRPPRSEPAPSVPKPQQPADDERALRGLVGAGESQLSVAAAMRARDASRPTDDDLAAAERDVVVVHRNHVPPGPLAKARKPTRRPQDGPGSSPVRS